MAAAITDLLSRVTDSTTGRPVISALAAPGKALAASSINLSDVTNWSTVAVLHISIYNTITVGGVVVKDPTTQTDWKGTLSGSVVSNLVLTGGSDRTYAAGAIVEITPTARWAKDLYDLLITLFNQDASLKPGPIQTALNIGSGAANGWNALGFNPTVASGFNKGSKEFDLTFAGVDLSSTLSPGMRMKFDRGTAAPTQCVDLESGSSQYATKASPSGIAFTGNFTIEAWIKLESYTGVTQMVLNRENGTTGWGMYLSPNGQPVVYYGSAANFRNYSAYQSLPLGRWVHLAGVVTSVASGTFAVYIDGVLVPGVTTSGSATSFTQPAVDLRMGAYANSPSLYVDGEMTDVRVWSIDRTATQIRDNMSIQLTGSETNLVGYWKLNGNFNDSTTNANNMTGSGGAVATTLDNPMKSTEFAIITKVVFSTNTTVTVFTGTDYSVPNLTLSNTFYSTHRAPYGFPADRGKWMVEMVTTRYQNSGALAANTWTNLGHSLAIPTGCWNVDYQTWTIATHVGDGFLNTYTTLSTANNSESDPLFTCAGTSVSASLTQASGVNSGRRDNLQLTAQTVYYLNGAEGIASTTMYFGATSGILPIVYIRAECAYV